MQALREETLAAIQEVSASTEQMRRNTETIAATAEQLSVSRKEILDDINGKAQEIIDLSSNQAIESQESLLLFGAVNQAIETARKSSLAIADIADLMHVYNTNTSCEAARQGARGAGIAVIARYMNDLVEKARTISKEIQTTLTSNIEAITKLSESVKKSIESSRNIAEKMSGKMAETLVGTEGLEEYDAQITNALSEQVAGIEQINAAIQSISAELSIEVTT